MVSTPPPAPPHDNPEVRHEPADINYRWVVGTAIGILVMAAIIQVVCWWLFAAFEAREKSAKASPFPLAAQARDQPPPEPRLEGIKRLEGEETPAEQLMAPPEGNAAYRWVDKEQQIVTVPVDTAMEIMLQKNLFPSSPPPQGEKESGQERQPPSRANSGRRAIERPR